MRTYILIFATIGLLLLGFFLYWHFQPPALTLANPVYAPVLAPTTASTERYKQIGSGNRPWVRQVGPHGEVSTQFRAEQYLPRKDGTIRLVSPEADFFLGNNQRLHVTGDDGEVVMKDLPDVNKALGGSGPSGPPNRGRLNNVVMKLVDDNATDPTHATVLTLYTNNVEFDNESFLITTEGYTAADGAIVMPDQVPVKIRGQYEFDGRGLTLRWNDRDGQVELLEIAHGEQLKILHPGGADGAPAPATAPADVAPAASVAAPATNPAGLPPDQSGGQPRLPASAPTPLPGAAAGAAPKPKPLYLAVFQKSIRITQGKQTLITADTMRLHFRQKSEHPSAKTSTSDAPGATTALSPPLAAPASAAAVSAARSPGESRARPTGSPSEGSPSDGSLSEASPSDGSLSNESAERGSATPERDQPIVVRWSGKLRITPETTPPPRPVVAGDSLLELVGLASPVFVHRNDGQSAPGEVRCATLTYLVSNGSAVLLGSSQFGPVELTRAGLPRGFDEQPGPPTEITTDHMEYSGAEHVATLGGIGHASLPLAAEEEANGMLDARWTSGAQFFFTPGQRNELFIQRSAFIGNVKIRHPQLALDSQRLTLDFARVNASAKPVALGRADTAPERAILAAATQPSVREQTVLSDAIAEQDVHCRMKSSGDHSQDVDCRRLELHMGRGSDNKMLARQVDAIGDVRASDGSQQLSAQQVQMLLRPTRTAVVRSAPDTPENPEAASVELERMDAREQVKVISKDGSIATSDQLLVVMDGDAPHVTLTGTSLARVIDIKHNELTGPAIVIEPKRQHAKVIGSGTLHMAGEPAGPSTLSASTPARAGGAARRMDVIWSDTAELDGVANAIDLRGRVEATMPDADGTVNKATCDHLHVDLVSKPAAATQPATAPVAGGPMQMDLLRDKQPGLITLDQNAVIQSRQVDAGKNLLREFELKAPRVLYALTATMSMPARTLFVPSAGVMLVRDYRPAAPAEKQANDQGGLGSGRGATAFRWNHRLMYSEDARRAAMYGNVEVVHESDSEKELPVQLLADELTAAFDRSRSNLTPPRPADASEALQLKSLEALGNVVVHRGVTQVLARRIEFQPSSHWMTAQGSADRPVVVTDDKGTESSADEAQWNTQTWDFKMRNMSGAGSQQRVERGKR